LDSANHSLLLPLSLDLFREAVLDHFNLHLFNLLLEAGLGPFQNLNALIVITAHFYKLRRVIGLA